MNANAWVMIVLVVVLLWYAIAYVAFFDLHRYGTTIKTPQGAFLWWLLSPLPPVCLIVVWYWVVTVSDGMFPDTHYRR